MTTPRQRIWGWFFFDWASQPYNTLLLTFIFAPYVTELLDDGVAAQTAWGFGVGAAGLAVAFLAPLLGAIADASGRRLPWIWVFSVMYVAGAAGLWFAEPGNLNLLVILACFAVGLIGMEFATIFTNAMLPDLGSREEIGRISGNGWAFGYLGGLLALVLILALFAESAETGRTVIGHAPIFGLDPDTRQGTRFVGPFTAAWYALFMIPFFLFITDAKEAGTTGATAMDGLRALRETLKTLPSRTSLSAFLLASMLYRDALNGIYAFGGLYAAGMLGWSVIETGTFGILAIASGAFFAWLGGRADVVFGSKLVVRVCIVALTLAAVVIVFVSRQSVLGLHVAPDSRLPDIAFYLVGFVIGGAGGSLQAASRTLMVAQAEPYRMTEAFGLYALAGKATSFIAPLAIGIVTAMSGSQPLGVVPIIVLFVVGFVLLHWVQPEGDRAA